MNLKKSLWSGIALSLLAVCVLLITPPTNSQGQGNGNGNGPDKDIIPHKMNQHGADAVTAGSTGTVSPAITYHGGPLIPTPTIYYIWYGNWNLASGSDTAAGKQILRDFAQSIGGSSHYQINNSYSTNGYNIAGNVTWGGEANDAAYSRGKRLKDADIKTIVTTAISSGQIPFNTNGVYFVLTTTDVTLTSGFCTQYCGWHTSAAYNSSRLRYSFVGNANRCLNACSAQTVSPNGNAGVDAMVSIITHELEETATDADPGAAPGWYDSGGAENADKCAWTFGQNILTLPSGAKYNLTLGGRNYLIQRNLKATDNKCYVDLTHQ